MSDEHRLAETAVRRWLTERLGPLVGGPVAANVRAAEPVETWMARLDSETKERVRAVIRRVLVDTSSPRPPPATAKDAAPIDASMFDPVIFDTVVRAFVQCRPLAIVYRDAEGAVTERRVEPHGLHVRSSRWYLVSYDRAKHDTRSFRLDRIESAHPMLGTFTPRAPRELFEDTDGISLT